ncbi:MAG: trigger factor [Calditrichaeota bacterium]|nr:trigger factor [Calditrichota bacterium]
MNVTVENNKLNDVQHELSVAVPAEFMQAELERGIEAVKSHAKIPGFRPGKIPRNVLVQRFGPAVTEDTVQRVLQDAYRTALDQEKLHPVSPGEMSEISFEPGQPLTFKVVVEILPEIALPELATIAVTLKEPQAGDEDVTASLESLRESQAVLVPTEDPVDDHSVITFDLQELDDSGLPLVGRSQKDVSIDMSRQQFGEEFASKVKGLACEQSTTVEFKRSGAESGKPLRTQITIRNIQRKELPELDDDFVHSVNPNLASLDDLKNDLRRYIESRAGHAARQQMLREAADELLRKSEFTVPPRMLDNYLDRMTEEAEQRSNKKGDDAARKKFRDDYRASAVWTLRWYLMRNRLIQEYDLRATAEDMDQEIAQLATFENELAEDFKKRLSPDQMQQIQDDVQERKVLQFLEGSITVNKTQVSLAEFEGRAEPSKIISV